MMKLRNKLLLFLLCAACALMLTAQGFAAETIDPAQAVSMTVSYHDEYTTLAGASFRIYLVATVDASGTLRVTDSFKPYSVDIQAKDGGTWKSLATTLEGYALRDGLTPTDSGVTDELGCLRFPTGGGTLTQGLYLVLGQRHTQGGIRYDVMPFMVMLPTWDSAKGVWLYDVAADPKYEATPDVPSTVTRKVLKVWDDAGSESARPKEISVQLLRDGKVYDTVTLNAKNSWRYTWDELGGGYSWTVVEKELSGYTVRVERDGASFLVTNTATPETPPTPTPTPTPPSGKKLPQTGQLWWPVPVLAAAGLAFLVVGALVRRRRDNAE